MAGNPSHQQPPSLELQLCLYRHLPPPHLCDCGQTVATHAVTFHPVHVEFDTKELGRFLVHDRESDPCLELTIKLV